MFTIVPRYGQVNLSPNLLVPNMASAVLDLLRLRCLACHKRRKKKMADCKINSCWITWRSIHTGIGLINY